MESVSGNVVKGGIGSKTGNTTTGQSAHRAVLSARDKATPNSAAEIRQHSERPGTTHQEEFVIVKSGGK